MNEPRRLHPIYMLFFVVNAIKALIPAIAIFVLKGNDWFSMQWYWYAGGAALVAVLFIIGYLDWKRFAFSVEEDRLVIQKGVFFREEKNLYFRRIHSVNVEQPFVQRLFRVAQVKVETPGGDKKSDAALPALSLVDAHALRELLQLAGRKAAADEPQASALPTQNAASPLAGEREPAETAAIGMSVIQLPKKQLVQAGMSTMNFGLVVAFVAGLASFADDILGKLLPEYFYADVMVRIASGVPLYGLILIGSIVGLLLAWLLSFALFVLKYSGYTARKEGDQITVSYGLLEKKTYTFAADKVQAVIVKEGLLRQALGYAEIGLQVIASSKEEKIILHPFIQLRNVGAVLDGFLPLFNDVEIETKVPKRGRVYYFRTELVFTLLACAGLIALFGAYGAWSLLLLPPVLLLSWFASRDAGLTLKEKQLTIRSRDIARRTYIVRRPQIVTLRAKGTVFQRRKSLLTLSVKVLGSTGSGMSFGVRCFEREDVEAIWRWYSRMQRQ